MWVLWTYLAGILPVAYIMFRIWYPEAVRDGQHRAEAVKKLKSGLHYGDTLSHDEIEKERIRLCASDTGGLCTFIGIIWPIFLLVSAVSGLYKVISWPFKRMADKDIKAIDDAAALRKADLLAAEYERSQTKKWETDFEGEK